MSDHFQMLVDADASPAQAEEVARAVLARLRDLGLVTAELDRDCVPRGVGYRPGPAIPALYQAEKHEGRFWELVMCGVQAKVARSFNQWALGPVCEGFACPSCKVRIAPDDDFRGAIIDAVGVWMESDADLVACPECGKEIPVTAWECKPPLGFGNVSFTFWNWPPFASPSWKSDVVGIVQEVTGHDIVSTYGRS